MICECIPYVGVHVINMKSEGGRSRYYERFRSIRIAWPNLKSSQQAMERLFASDISSWCYCYRGSLFIIIILLFYTLFGDDRFPIEMPNVLPLLIVYMQNASKGWVLGDDESINVFTFIVNWNSYHVHTLSSSSICRVLVMVGYPPTASIHCPPPEKKDETVYILVCQTTQRIFQHKLCGSLYYIPAAAGSYAWNKITTTRKMWCRLQNWLAVPVERASIASSSKENFSPISVL